MNGDLNVARGIVISIMLGVLFWILLVLLHRMLS